MSAGQLIDYFDEQSGEWVSVPMDELGFPLTPERLASIEQAHMDYEALQELTRALDAELRAAMPPPQPPSPSPVPMFPSWVEGEDGLWYAPVPYPSESEPRRFMWDELDGAWIDMEAQA